MEIPVDPIWDGATFFTAQGAIVQSVNTHLLTSVKAAVDRYQTAHGTSAVSGDQLIPYLTVKIPTETLAEIFKASRTPLPNPPN